MFWDFEHWQKRRTVYSGILSPKGGKRRWGGTHSSPKAPKTNDHWLGVTNGFGVPEFQFIFHLLNESQPIPFPTVIHHWLGLWISLQNNIMISLWIIINVGDHVSHLADRPCSDVSIPAFPSSAPPVAINKTPRKEHLKGIIPIQFFYYRNIGILCWFLFSLKFQMWYKGV